MGKEQGLKESKLGREVGAKEQRKLRERKRPKKSVWFGLGLFGLVGWSVVVPMLLGVAVGLWLDKRFPGEHSWTLTFLLAGLVAGCLNAWYWLEKEKEEIHKELEENDQ